MLNNVFGFIGSVTRDVVEATTAVVDYVVDDISKIPESIEKGYNKGLISSPEVTENSNPTSGPKAPEISMSAASSLIKNLSTK